jgi:hypothetical protein
MERRRKACLAFVWATVLLVGINGVFATDYVAVDLGPSGFADSSAFGIAGGQQAGGGFGSATGGVAHALLWSGTAASAVDLHQFLPAGFIDSRARSIDDQGNIVGYATDSAGNSHAILWQVVSEPAAIVSLGMGALTAGLILRRRKLHHRHECLG